MTVRCEDKNLTLEQAGHVRNRYHYRVPVSHKQSDVLDPDYFGLAMSSNRLTVGDRIEIEWEDFSCIFEMIVLAQVPSVNQLICRPITEIVRFGDLDFPKDWEARHLGAAEHYGIFYKGVQKDQGFVSKEAALTRINAMIATDSQAASSRAMNAAMLETKATKPKKAEAKADEAA